MDLPPPLPTTCLRVEVAAGDQADQGSRLRDQEGSSEGPAPRRHFKGTTNCLSALLAAGRHEELLELLEMAPYNMWYYRKYGVKALVALGRKAEAIRYAEDDQGVTDSPVAVARACEEVLLSSGFAEEAYER